MKIGIIAPFNPYEVIDYLYDKYKGAVFQTNQAATAVNTIVRIFVEKGHDIVVFTCHQERNKGSFYFEGKNIKVYAIPYYTKIKTGPFNLYISYCRLKRLMTDKLADLDILHAHWTYEYAYAASYYADKLPLFCTVRDWAPYQLSLMKGKARLVWLIRYYMFKQVMKRPDRIHFIANSEYTQKCMQEYLNMENIPIISNPVKSYFILKDRTDYPEDFTFISIAQGLEKRKNFDVLMPAFQKFRLKYPEARLILVGKGFEYDNPIMQEWVLKGWLDNVSLEGFCNHDSLISLLDKSSALIHPSLEETFGNTLLEGMARRIPVIGGTNSGAVPLVLGNGLYGCLSDVTNVDGLLKGMLKLKEDSIYYEGLINRATQKLYDSYIDLRIYELHLNLYNKCLKN